MSLRAISIMVLFPLIAGTGAVLVFTPKDMLRQPVLRGDEVAEAPPPAPVERRPAVRRASIITLSDLADTELEPARTAAPLPVVVPVVPDAAEGADAEPVDRRWIVANGLNLRDGPGVQNTLIASLPRGTAVEVLETSGTWARVKSGELLGWLSANFLSRQDPSGGD